ncbi:MAG: twin-arginine translocase TatA/TatE family subunit [Chloroflexi bacterium]|nr:twin-arginine translocase TatA/TatE family subunit [Chloroflexota bacterium]
MNLMGIGPMELFVVAILAFFLLGPKKMAEAGKTFGKVLRELREQRDEFTSLLMESTDISDPDDKPKKRAVPPPVNIPAPVGAVSQSGDPGDGSEPAIDDVLETPEPQDDTPDDKSGTEGT